MKFLIIDDSRTLVKFINQSICDLGHSVIGEAHDGIQGFEKFKELKPDIVLLDITMPNRDGRECLTDILNWDPKAQVVMLSAVKSQQVIDDCLKIGAKDYIHKDDLINRDEFVSRITTIIQSKLVAS